MAKTCSACLVDLPLDAFRPGKRYVGGKRARCRNCDNAKRRSYLKQHPYKRTNQITPAEYQKLFKEQNGLCAICKHPEQAIDPRYNTPRSLAVDHNHMTGLNRGLLCTACNTALGKMEDNIERLQAAITYLRKHG